MRNTIKYKADILKMESLAKEGKLDNFELLFYLENWWINHILNFDLLTNGKK